MIAFFFSFNWIKQEIYTGAQDDISNVWTHRLLTWQSSSILTNGEALIDRE